MRKQLLISLLLYTTLTTSTMNAASSADEFFAEAKKNPDISVLAPIFSKLPPQEQQEISVKVKTQSARDLGITANLFFVLKDYLQNGKFVKSATPSAIAILHKEQEQEKASASKQTTKNQETDAQKLHKEFETQRKQREAAEEQRKQRAFDAQLADLKNKESTDRATIADDASLEKFKSPYDQSLAEAKNAEEQRKQTELFNAQLANLKNQESADRAAMENSEQNVNLQDKYDQSLAEAQKAEAQRKQREFNTQLTDLQNAENADRAAIANNTSLEKFKPEYTQSLEEAQKAEAQRKQTELFNAQLDGLKNAESTGRTAIADDASLEKFKPEHTQSLAEAKKAEAQREQTELFNAQLDGLKNAESTGRTAIADDAIIENSERNERNELSRRFQTEKSRLEEEQRKKAEQLQEDNRRRALAAIEDAERDAEKSMGAILQNELNELTDLHRQIALQLENLTLEAAKRKRLEEKKQEIETLTEKVTIAQRDLKDTDESIFLVANEAIDIMLKTYKGNREKIEEIDRFRNAIQTNDINKIERILRTLQDFSDRGMIQAAAGSRTTASDMFSGFITWYSQKVHMTDELRRNINQLKRELN